MSPASVNRALQSLDQIELGSVFRRRPFVLQGIPGFARGYYRSCWRFALRRLQANRNASEIEQSRIWKLILFLSRMLLHKDKDSDNIPKEDVIDRFRLFWQGDWIQLLRQAGAFENDPVRQNRHPHSGDAQEHRIARATTLIHQGELSAARQVLNSAGLAPGTLRL